MTVKELIDKLKDMPMDADIRVYTYSEDAGITKVMFDPATHEVELI